MSQNIYELMSDEGKEHCRRIDKVDQIYSDFHFGFYFFICFSNFSNLNFYAKFQQVTVKGSEVPIDIYTYDCLQDQVHTGPYKNNSAYYLHLLPF